MKLINPVDRAFYYVRDDGSVCCGKLHGTRKAADACVEKPAASPPKRSRSWTRRDRDEDPRAEERDADARRALRIDSDEDA